MNLVNCLQQLGDINQAKCTPKVATIGPVKFYRSKNGNMYRSGIIKAHRLAFHYVTLRKFSIKFLLII